MNDSAQTSSSADAPSSMAMPLAPLRPLRERTLRWWPAAAILVAMLAVRTIPRMLEAPPFPILMLGFLGPAAVGLLIFIWWLAASRAGWLEKILGLVGFIGIAVLGISLIHFSMKGMSVVILALPTAIVAFTIALIAFARSPRYRVPIALLATAMTFGFWNTVQSSGVTGDFSAELSWRWNSTAEQTYLNELAAQDKGQSGDSADSVPVTLASSQWPAFRGSVRDGVLAGVALEEDWKTSPPKKLWSTKIGPGWSSFSVAGDRLFTQEQRAQNEAVVCLDAGSGNRIWSFVYPSRFWESVAGAGPRATPTIADEGLYALGANGILVCLNATSGKEIWQRDLKVDAGRQPPQWGFSASPLVSAGIVIVHAGGSGDKGVLGYDAKTGEPRWSVASGDHSYSSAQLATFDSIGGVLMSSNAGLQFIDVADGHTIWEHQWAVENYRALQPLVADSSILLATSLGAGTRRLTVSRDADGQWKVVEDWTSLDLKPDFNDFVLYDKYIYGFDGNIFACIDFETGRRQWKKGRYGSGQVLLLADAGQLLVTSEKGEVVLLHATPDKLDELGRFTALEGKTWNHPVMVGNHLYVRNAEEAACYELVLK